MKAKLSSVFTVACLWAPLLFAGNSESMKEVSIGLILPFKTQTTLAQVDRFLNASDVQTASKIRLSDEAKLAMDFLMGAQIAMQSGDSIRFNVEVYDNYDNDSVTRALLKEQEAKLMKHQIIVGPNSTSTARLVADFCRRHKIWNIQPFSPSRTVGDSNLYLIRLNPSVESIAQNIFHSLKDSFTASHIIIYTARRGVEFDAALLLDSLIRSDDAFKKGSHTVCMTGDTNVKAPRCILTDMIKKDKHNVVVATSLNVNIVQNFVRNLDGTNTVLYGMPNWIYSDFLRLDYLNQLHTRLPECFWIDSSAANWITFNQSFQSTYETDPSRHAYLGYDVFMFLQQQLTNWGLYFMTQPEPIEHKGAAYTFSISRNTKAGTISSWENRYCNILVLQDYQLHNPK